jgi:hypothetical protein
MSGIVGLWNLDGRPLDHAVVSRMSASRIVRTAAGDWSSVYTRAPTSSSP